jgi:3-isopropylmalate/(R)-2-methylmalate dehydratase small subunit
MEVLITMNTAEGNAFIFGNNIDTDVIIPARYLTTFDPEKLKLHCMEAIDPDFLNKISNGDIIVAGKNFGCGSSREHAPIAIKAAGISCVIAESFARIFYRNSINIGMPIIESKEASEKISANDRISIDFNTGVIYNKTKNEEYQSVPFPPFIQNIITKGGLMSSIKEEI